MFGQWTSDIGWVVKVMVIGDVSHSKNDSLIKRKDMVKPQNTIVIQNIFANQFLAVKMYDNPWIVEASKYSFNTSIMKGGCFSNEKVQVHAERVEQFVKVQYAVIVVLTKCLLYV